MTGNIALDVFIGLAFIYLLYSLYATIIVEIIAGIFGLRAKNLQYAIRRMLTDSDKPAVIVMFNGFSRFKFFRRCRRAPKKRSIVTIILKLPEGKFRKFLLKLLRILKRRKKEELYNLFYLQPTIKYLSKPGFLWEGRPSYLSSHSFSKALIDCFKLKSTSRGENITLYTQIKSGIRKCRMGKETRHHIKSLMEDANNDLLKFKLLLELWFNDTMERSIGWYKRTNQLILLIMGLILAVAFNLNTLYIARLLSKDSKAREQMVQIASSNISKYEDKITEIQRSDNYDMDEIRKYQKQADSLSDINDELRADMSSTQVLFGGGWNLPGKKVNVEKEINDRDKKGYLKKKVKSGVIYVKIPDKKYPLDTMIFKKCIRSKKAENNQKTYYFSAFKYKCTYAVRSPWGYLLTALAISLGSPFWFDLLNKLVKLRGSVRQSVTSESKEKTSQQPDYSGDNPLNRKG